jgi:hypothetical protein
MHTSDEVARRKRFSIFDWSLNFVSHENDELLCSVINLVQNAIKGKSYQLYSIQESDSTKYSDKTVVINSFLGIPSIDRYVKTWNDEANITLQRITSESKIDQDSLDEANRLKIHQDWIKKISMFMSEWNELCPFNDYKFEPSVIKSNNLVELEYEIVRMSGIYDFA